MDSDIDKIIKKEHELQNSFTLKKEDVWGDPNNSSRGMIVARYKERCPVWADVLPYKSVTVICDQKQANEVIYWLTYVNGGGCISRQKTLAGNKIAFRSDYMCW